MYLHTNNYIRITWRTFADMVTVCHFGGVYLAPSFTRCVCTTQKQPCAEIVPMKFVVGVVCILLILYISTYKQCIVCVCVCVCVCLLYVSVRSVAFVVVQHFSVLAFHQIVPVCACCLPSNWMQQVLTFFGNVTIQSSFIHSFNQNNEQCLSIRLYTVLKTFLTA